MTVLHPAPAEMFLAYRPRKRPVPAFPADAFKGDGEMYVFDAQSVIGVAAKRSLSLSAITTSRFPAVMFEAKVAVQEVPEHEALIVPWTNV